MSKNFRIIKDHNGTIQSAYSYNTCIMARLPNGRVVLNENRYGTTTAKHQCNVRCALSMNELQRAANVVNAGYNLTEQSLIALAFKSNPDAINHD